MSSLAKVKQSFTPRAQEANYQAGYFISVISLDALKAHQKTHTGENSYVCDELRCDCASAWSGGLKAHQRKCTGEHFRFDGPE